MITITQREFEKNIERTLNNAQKEPVHITREDQPSDVVLSWRKYQYYVQLEQDMLAEARLESEGGLPEPS